ncbi:hypothetical protein K7432_017439 [Basidiobolus ranarum]|uniref:DNA-directed RNA polymerase n=1 Tax=Basidiobolus ranarum TaxID=34480 RepID=A0ABR2WDD8_9FUNG
MHPNLFEVQTNLLEKFFDKYGFDANICNSHNYVLQKFLSKLQDKFGQDINFVPPKLNYVDAIIKRKTYEGHYEHGNGKVVCKIPLLNDKGYYIINGIKHVPLIQELQNNFIPYVSQDDNVVYCKTRFKGALLPLRVCVKNSVDLYLDVSSTHKDLNGMKYMSVYWILNNFGYNFGKIYKIFAFLIANRYDFNAFLTIFLSSVTESKNTITPNNLQILESKHFPSQDKRNVAYTLGLLSYMALMTSMDIVQPMDQDDYGNKTGKALNILLDQILNRAIKLSDTENCLQTCLDDKLLTMLKEGQQIIHGKIDSKMKNYHTL